uniref:Uncharacterized protein n=1 Tax=Rhizophora mucronata TaxID=61149 RepID=A0A2P2JDB6_RHIMU
MHFQRSAETASTRVGFATTFEEVDDDDDTLALRHSMAEPSNTNLFIAAFPVLLQCICHQSSVA